MEEVNFDEHQLLMKFSTPKVKYTKTSRFRCRKTYDGKEIGAELTYRCTSCGEFKNPDANAVCDRCSTQFDMFGGKE